MKKINFALAAIFALTFVGCQKESVKDLTPATITLNGIYAESLDVVKSDYELSGTTYNFKWVANDKFIAQSYNSSTTTYGSTLFTATAGDAAQVPFTGTPESGYELGTYAFYPNDGASGNTNLSYKGGEITPVEVDADVTAETATVSMAGTITEDKAHPMAHIPMIGVKDANGDYQFTACTGVLKITIKDLPTSATLIRIDRASGTFPLNGNFVFDTNYEIKSSYLKGTSWGEKYLNITSSATVEDRSFYFPLPTGTIGAGEINISISDGSSSLYLVTNKVAITLSKGVVTELPAFTYRSQPAKVTITGSSSSPSMHFWHDASVVRIRGHISTSSIHNLGEYPTSVMSFSTNYASYNLTNWTGTDKLTDSNKYYLHWIALDTDVSVSSLSGLTDEKVKAYGTIPFYYLAPVDEALAGTYKFEALYCLAYCDRSTWRNLTDSDDNRLVLAVSDNSSKGSVMITDYMGLKSDGTVTNKSLTNSNSDSVFQLKTVGDYLPCQYLNPALFAPGTRVYGWLNHSNGYISFENTANQSLFNYNGVAYTLRNGLANYSGFIFEYDKSASPKKITYGSSTPLALVPYNAIGNGSGQFDGADSMLYPSKSNSGAQGGIVGYKQ